MQPATWPSPRMLMAGLDGIENKIDPGEPLDKDIYALSPEELQGRPDDARLARARRSTRLEEDHDFLLKGDVFTEDVDRDVDRVQDAKPRSTRCALRPPAEFGLYYDI
ncbi:MAG: glutamine synthetase [Comamonadaceae bacterium]|nr:glutamine synthetase [Comamonadaceae bacterium]